MAWRRALLVQAGFEHDLAAELAADGGYDLHELLGLIDEDAWATLRSDMSRPFDKPETGRIAVKVINHLGDEVMKVFRVT